MFLPGGMVLSFASRGRWGPFQRKEKSLGCICFLLLLLQNTLVSWACGWGHQGVPCPSCAPRVDSPLRTSQLQPRPGDHLGVAFPAGTWTHSRPPVNRSAVIFSVCSIPALGLLAALPNMAPGAPGLAPTVVPQISLYT